MQDDLGQENENEQFLAFVVIAMRGVIQSLLSSKHEKSRIFILASGKRNTDYHRHTTYSAPISLRNEY